MSLEETVKCTAREGKTSKVLIHIKGAKGRKDRYTLLSDIALQTLREYYKAYKPQE